MAWPAPVELSGAHATLRPLAHEHHDGLCAATRDGELWRLWYTAVPSPEGMAAEIERRLSLQASGSMLPFTVFDAAGQIVGMTTYMNIDAKNHRVEIGSTWTAARCQRSPLNTQCKRLLLGHAFEQLDCIAVEFRTHRLNTQSRRAIERLGAQLDGILRAHQRSADGTIRDTAVYSITAPEWPPVKSHLDWQLIKPRQPGNP
jgi:RimJ/RimL family protein N-acetyltransferase